MSLNESFVPSRRKERLRGGIRCQDGGVKGVRRVEGSTGKWIQTLVAVEQSNAVMVSLKVIDPRVEFLE